MTDNSDFVARYLRSDDEDRPEHIDRSSIDDESVVGQGYPVVELKTPHSTADTLAREPLAPAAHHRNEEGRTGRRTGQDRSPVEKQQGFTAPAQPQQDYQVAPQIGQRHDPPERLNNSTLDPLRIPPASKADEDASTTLPHGWSPRVDPADRWAPQAGPESRSSLADQHIQLSEVVRQRREPPEMGWRKLVYLSTGHLVNLGAGPAERRLLAWKAHIVANIPGNYQIAAISVKGGVGKSRISAGVGSVFAELRKQPVIAIDANPTYGGLGRLIDPRVQTSVRDFLAAEDLVDYPRARYYTGQNKQGLEVLAGNQNVADPMDLNASTFTDAVSRVRRFYQLAVVDCGGEIEHSVIPAVLSASDALMIIGTCSVEGALAIETTIDWLAARNGHALLKRSVVVLNDSHRSASKSFIDHVHGTLGKRVLSVKTIPWDPHLQDAVTLDFPALKRRTRLAFVELAAEMAGGFPTAGALAV